MTEILAIIPARGGSKSIPRKNIRDFAGHPLIAYSIKTALSTKLINRVIVSTDDPEIARLAKHYGAEVPFLRPVKLAQDNSLDISAFIHALAWLKDHEDYQPDIIVHLRPTSPLREVKRITAAIKLLLGHPEADSVRAVIPPSQNPFKMWTISANGFLQPLVKTKIKEAYNGPRQALPPVYWQTGYVDVIRTKTILDQHSMTGKRISPLILNPNDYVDIDTPEDWLRAERLASKTGLADKLTSGEA